MLARLNNLPGDVSTPREICQKVLDKMPDHAPCLVVMGSVMAHNNVQDFHQARKVAPEPRHAADMQPRDGRDDTA